MNEPSAAAPLLRAIGDAFGGVEKPLHFCDHEHCDECAEHDQTLLTHSVDSISLLELGNPGWDPVCMINTRQGYEYYLPAFARLALGRGDEYYLQQFLFHLNDERIAAMAGAQRMALADFLMGLIDLMADEIERNLDTDVLLQRVQVLQTPA